MVVCMLLYKGHECQGWNKDKHKLLLLQCHQLIAQRLSFPGWLDYSLQILVLHTFLQRTWKRSKSSDSLSPRDTGSEPCWSWLSVGMRLLETTEWKILACCIAVNMHIIKYVYIVSTTTFAYKWWPYRTQLNHRVIVLSVHTPLASWSVFDCFLSCS